MLRTVFGCSFRLLLGSCLGMLSNGCAISSTRATSSLRGEWEIVEGDVVSTSSGLVSTRDSLAGQPNQAAMWIEPDGSFDLTRIYTPYLGARGLRVEGDRWALGRQAPGAYIVCTHAHYTPTSSEVVLRCVGTVPPYFAKSVSLAASLRDDGTMDFLYIAVIEEHKQESRARLRRVLQQSSATSEASSDSGRLGAH